MNKLKICAPGLLMLGECCSIFATTTQPPDFVDAVSSATYAVGIDYGLSPTPAVTIAASGTPMPSITESGALPNGIAFSATFGDGSPSTSVYAFTGKPGIGSEGTYHLTLTASNGVSPNATLAFTLTIVDGTVAVPITNGFTGNWFDTSENGHGFSIEVLPGNQMLAEWYVFAPNGGQSWIVATGPITGNTAVLQGFQPVGSGGRFPPNFNSSQLQSQPWGTITFTFTDCNTGTASWQPTAQGYASGSIPIARLTIPVGLVCPISID